MSAREIALISGSGTSQPAGLPCVETITDRVLSGAGFRRYTDGTYYFTKRHEGVIDETERYKPRVLELLRILKREADPYYLRRGGQPSDYEGLYYIASQIFDSKLGEVQNPVVQTLTQKIEEDVAPLLRADEKTLERDLHLHELTGEALVYIRGVVQCLLSVKPASTDHFSLIREMVEDAGISKLEVFTVNHDTLMEQYLSHCGIEFCDGFIQSGKDVRRWKAETYESTNVRTRLFKLHGGVNWFRFRPDGGHWEEEFIGIPLNGNPYFCVDEKGRRLEALEPRPVLLVGTFNKMFEYTSGPFAELQFQLHKSLKRKSVVVIIGYGFRDAGVNTRIVEWMFSAPDKKMAIVDPGLDAVRTRMPSGIRERWDQWRGERRIVPILKGIKDVTWDEIRTSLFST